jgi:hypothetical protein
VWDRRQIQVRSEDKAMATRVLVDLPHEGRQLQLDATKGSGGMNEEVIRYLIEPNPSPNKPVELKRAVAPSLALEGSGGSAVALPFFTFLFASFSERVSLKRSPLFERGDLPADKPPNGSPGPQPVASVA